MNKILTIAVCIYLAAMLNACTNSKSDEGNPDQAPVESSLDNPDGGGAPATADAKAANPDEAQAGFLDDQLPDDSMDKKAAANTPPPAADAAGTNTAATPPPADSAPLSLDEPPANNPPADNMAASLDAPPPAVDNKTDMASNDSMDKSDKKSSDMPAASDEPPKPKAALQKIKDAPYHEGDQLLNTVYITRPGDDYKKVSTMIYGSNDKAKDLKAANPGVKKMKPGQKIYYSSPKRPMDESKMMTYYEDSGIPAETYVAKDGDDLKKVSKDLVGYSDGWKEVWATNAVESKGKLPAGTELKYWKGTTSGAPATTVATNDAPPPTNSTPPPVAMPDQASNLPPPPSAGATPPPMPDQANMPPPPPPMPDQAKAGDVPPPPPANGEMTPPPPGGAAGMAANKKIKPAVPPPEEGLDQETMMYLGVAGAVAAGLAAIIIIRKRKANRNAAGYEAQVS